MAVDARSEQSFRTDQSLLVGTVLGALAWGLGYVVTYLFVAGRVRESGLSFVLELLEGEPATYELVGWVFYNAHLVETVFRDVPVIGSRSVSYLGGEGGFSVLLYAVPVVALAAAGLAMARYQGATDASSGALSGATVFPGYLLLSTVGAFLFEVNVGGASGGPDILLAITFAGVIYPTFFGGAGGAIGASVARYRS